MRRSVRRAAARMGSHTAGHLDPEVAAAGMRPVVAAFASHTDHPAAGRMTSGDALGGIGGGDTPPILGGGPVEIGTVANGSEGARRGMPPPADDSPAIGSSEADDRSVGSAPPRIAMGGACMSEPAIRFTTGRLIQLAHHLTSLAVRLPKTSLQDAETALVDTSESLISCVYELRSSIQVSDNGVHSAIRLAAEKYIERNLASFDMSPDTISRGLGVTRSTLYRTFTGASGISRYIQDRRLAAAKSLLLHPEEYRSITEIADSLGFLNASTFSRQFRRRFGCPPRDMRRRGMQIEKALWRDRDVVSPH